MKVAVLSDIHGNLPALRVVLAHIDGWQPDHVVVNGDVVNRGPKPRECWELIAERIAQHGWQMTLGNHEEYTLAWRDQTRTLTPLEQDFFESSRWTHAQLDAEMCEQIAALPTSLRIAAPDGSEIYATHGSPRGNTDGTMPWMTDDQLREKMGAAPAVFVTSHTHRFFKRQVDNTLIVNSGSVGCPLDGDTRTGYAQLTWDAGTWQAHLLRLDYDRAETRRDWETTHFCEIGGSPATLMFAEWEQARSHMPFWWRAYHDKVHAGEIEALAAIKQYLATVAAA